jgi:hypothetical protein
MLDPSPEVNTEADGLGRFAIEMQRYGYTTHRCGRDDDFAPGFDATSRKHGEF